MKRIEEILLATLDDRHLSRGEKKAFGEILLDINPDERELTAYRHHAFEIARRKVNHPKAREIVEWLEDVLKVLAHFAEDRQPERVAEAYFGPGDECPTQIVRHIQHTHESLDVCVFTITDDRVANALLEAHGRGVKMRVISDDDKASDTGSDIGKLRQAGIPVRFDDSPHHMHHKFALFDEHRLLTGSYNWTRSAARYNQENIVISSDERLVRAFSRTFEELWKQFG